MLGYRLREGLPTLVLLLVLVVFTRTGLGNLLEKCNSSTTTLQLSQDGERAKVGKAFIAQERCSLGCQFAISADVTIGRSQCIEGCLFHYLSSSLTLADCEVSCESTSEASSCVTGCSISNKFLRSSPEPVANSTRHCNVSGTMVPFGEKLYLTENGTCNVLTCQNSSSSSNFPVICRALGDKSCPTNGSEYDLRLAKCCGFCGMVPDNPSVVLNATLTPKGLALQLPVLSLSQQGVVILRVETSGPVSEINYHTLNRLADQPFLLNISGYEVCTQLTMDYTVVSLLGASDFSPPTLHTVAPGPVVELKVEFSESRSPLLARHARVNITWEQPLLSSVLTGYVVSLKSNDSDESCQGTGLNQTILPKDSLGLTLPASSEPPVLYDCRYSLTVTTLPGQVPVTTSLNIRYSRRDRLSLTVSCRADYRPETQDYDIQSWWSFGEPLAELAVQDYGIRLSTQSPNSRISVTQLNEILPGQNTSHTFPAQRILTGDQVYIVEVQVIADGANFPWRTNLLPTLENKCTTSLRAPPHPPSNITLLQLSEESFRKDPPRDLLIITGVISWGIPQYPNGRILEYQLRLIHCRTSFVHFERKVAGSVNKYQLIDVGIPLSDSDNLCLQMRSRNEYDQTSSWGEALLINVALPTDTPTSQSQGLPLYGLVLIFILVGVLLVMIGVVAGLLWVCFKKHRAIKFDPLLFPMNPHSPTKSSFKRPVQHRSSAHSLVSNLLFTMAPIPSTDQWEIPTGSLKIFYSQPLGKGAFGEVYKGHVSSHVIKMGGPRFSLACTVAVKKLKENASSSEKMSFLKEIDTMKTVSDSTNEFSKFIVNMVGCVTVQEPLLLVLEYVKHGDLLKYLREMKQNALGSSQNDAALPYLEPEGAYSHLVPRSDLYEDLDTMTEQDLLDFSRQIAAGMEYLSGLDIVHRDLACRNILVGDNKNLKISDFGLSRHVPNNEAYVLTSHGQLPLRWMAQESIFLREFTTASDVWSYGIVLWEICTMGDVPYPVYSNREMVDQLRRGYRNPKPNKCSPEVYEVMLHCWCDHPEDRPSFLELRQRFDTFLSVHTQHYHPYIEIPDQPYEFDRLAPETGQAGRNSFLDGGDSPLNLDLSSEDQPDGEEQDKRSPNRNSLLSNSMELLDTTDQPPSIIIQPSAGDHHSPSSSLFNSDNSITIESDLLNQLDHRLSVISVSNQTNGTRKIENEEIGRNRMQAVRRKSNEPRRSEKSDTKSIEISGKSDTKSIERSGKSELKVFEESTNSKEMAPEGATIESTADVSTGVSGEGGEKKRETLLERKKKDYFKFTLIPTYGVQLGDGNDDSAENKEVLI